MTRKINSTEPLAFRTDRRNKQRYNSMSKTEKQEVMDKLREVFQVLCDGDYVDLSSEIFHLQNELNYCNKRLVNIEENLKYWQSLKEEYESQIDDISREIEERNEVYTQYIKDMKRATSQFIMLCYHNQKDLLVFQEVIEEYSNRYTVNEIVNYVREYVYSNRNTVYNIDTENILLSNKLICAIEDICDGLRISE